MIENSAYVDVPFGLLHLEAAATLWAVVRGVVGIPEVVIPLGVPDKDVLQASVLDLDKEFF